MKQVDNNTRDKIVTNKQNDLKWTKIDFTKWHKMTKKKNGQNCQNWTKRTEWTNGQNLISLRLKNNIFQIIPESRGDNDQKEKEEENEKEENVFDNQLTLPSQMTNINCKLATPNPTKCLECDFQVGSVLQYKCHLLVHYQSQVEKDVEDLFKEVKGLCKECNDLRPMDFADFTRHFALDHDRIYNVVSAQVKNHLTIAFPGSDVIMSKPDEDTKENSIANDTFEENIQIEIEPVDDKEEEIDQEDNLKNESLKPAENSVDVN